MCEKLQDRPDGTPKRRYPKPEVTVLLQPGERCITLPRPKTAAQLLEALGLAPETALVARNGCLLTHDRRIEAGDELLVRTVASSG